jgi:hypothetical protein
MRKVLDRLSYANVTATLALFIALGGTSYAVATLPRDSVGPKQLRTNSVGGPEIRKQAVRSSDIGDRSVRLRDIAKSTRDALQGQVGPAGPQGPAGPTFAVTVDSAGFRVRGSQVGFSSSGPGRRLIQFPRSIASCVPTATLTMTPGGSTPIPPSNGRIRTEVTSDGRALVEMWDPNGQPAFYPFNLVVAC